MYLVKAFASNAEKKGNKTMKKLLTVLLSVLMCLTMFGCSGGGEGGKEGGDDTPKSGADTATFEELLAAGKENGKPLTIYTTHSVINDAIEAFMIKYELDGKIEYSSTQIGDTNQITQVATEVAQGVDGADIIFIQDGGRVLTDLVEEGYVYNWYNKEIQDLVGEDCEPLLVWDYCNKVFIYNVNAGDKSFADGEINNIWYATDPQYAGAVCMKDPSSEGVNMNFLVNLTSDENAAKMADAYKAYYGKDIVLDADCPNAGYQFIKMLYKNGMVLGSSDSTIAKDTAASDKKMSALITLNKYKKSVGKRDDGSANMNFAQDVNPVAGFIYPIYGLQVKNADNPELAKAFLIWLYSAEGWKGDGTMTIKDGSVYKGMSGRFGDYSGNQANPVVDGDLPVKEWKKILIQEDAKQAAEARADVEDFILKIK